MTTKKSSKLKKVTKLHSSCVKGFLMQNRGGSILDDTERDSRGFGLIGKNENLYQEQKMRKHTFFLKIRSFCLVF